MAFQGGVVADGNPLVLTFVLAVKGVGHGKAAGPASENVQGSDGTGGRIWGQGQLFNRRPTPQTVSVFAA